MTPSGEIVHAGRCQGKGEVAQRGPGVLPAEDCIYDKEIEEMSPL